MSLPHPTAVITGSMCAASVRCYAAALRAGTLLIDIDEVRLPLRHSHHRYRVDGTGGVQTLTVPLTGPTNNMATPLSEVRLSEHGDWRRLHWGALYSAYGRSPYFDYVADDLHRVIVEGRQQGLHEFNSQLHQVIVEFMDLPLVTRELQRGEATQGMLDLRGRIAMKRPDNLAIATVPYYQMWASHHGFQPDLSILDLMMNMGREGIVVLMQMSREL